LLACLETSAAFPVFYSTLGADFASDFFSGFESIFLFGVVVSVLDLTSILGSGTGA